MELTKKQMATLRRIMKREEKAYDPQEMFCRPGIHPCGLDYLITDGQVSVILNHSPENLPAGGLHGLPGAHHLAGMQQWQLLPTGGPLSGGQPREADGYP